jgi:hypothetical protein
MAIVATGACRAPRPAGSTPCDRVAQQLRDRIDQLLGDRLSNSVPSSVRSRPAPRSRGAAANRAVP